jgi:heme-binding NEAT domain protein
MQMYSIECRDIFRVAVSFQWLKVGFSRVPQLEEESEAVGCASTAGLEHDSPTIVFHIVRAGECGGGRGDN